MRLIIFITAILLFAGSASADAWTTTEGGNKACTKLDTNGICYLTDIDADSDAISVRFCKTWTMIVYGTGADIMPQSCTDSTCAKATDLLATALTGDSPNTFALADTGFEFLRVDWTLGLAAPTVTLKCGG